VFIAGLGAATAPSKVVGQHHLRAIAARHPTANSTDAKYEA